ncbi:hypothetical protein BH23BAC3_BH23BAC3_24600 [soil metagenome]
MKNSGNWLHEVSKEAANQNLVEFHYIRYVGEEIEARYVIHEMGSVVEIRDDFGKGFLLRTKAENKIYTIWIPENPKTIAFDDNERIVTTKWSPVHAGWSFYPEISLHVNGTLGKDESICAIYLKIEDPDAVIFSELQTTDETESKRYLKSEWFDVRNPSDFWNYYINGNIYDPRADSSIEKKFKSQQCAFAWWGYFEMLSQSTGKKIYSLLQNEVARSVATDFENHGPWQHGYWFESMEIHLRFYLDGVHLMISQYEKSRDTYWLEIAKSAMNYVTDNLTDEFDNGNVWFLHDSIEDKRKHQIHSTIFGKSPHNSLCINTHVQALCVLQRLKAYDDNDKYKKSYDSGLKALLQVLEHQPPQFYFRLLEKYLLYSENRKIETKSSLRKGSISFQRFTLHKLYWKIMKKYPGLVYPCGFIERDLSLGMISRRYHIINIKDLLILYEGDPIEGLLPYIEKGVEFIENDFKIRPLEKYLLESPYFIEYQDILQLYDKLVAKKSSSELENCEKTIINTLGGVSLDSYAKYIPFKESMEEHLSGVKNNY